MDNLKFNQDGHFRILCVSDFHGCSGFNPKLTEGLSALLDETKPDFVFVLGDTAVGPFAEMTQDCVRQLLADMLEPIYSRGIPWAHVFGNHDRESGMSNEVQQKLYESLPLCMSVAGPQEVSGVGNYRLPVYSSDGKSVKYNLFALDSGRNYHDFVESAGLPKDTKVVLPDCFGSGADQSSPLPDQVMWYYYESLKAEKAEGAKIPALMFMHVPIIEFNLIWRNPEETDCVGSKREGLGCGELNCGLFMTCLQRGDVKGIFCGHEHLCDFQGNYCGITLAYDSAMGYNMSAHDDLRGGRVIDIYEDGRMYTRHVKLWDIMGKKCMRDPEYMEGGCRYFLRKL